MTKEKNDLLRVTSAKELFKKFLQGIGAVLLLSGVTVWLIFLGSLIGRFAIWCWKVLDIFG